jgi:hypothetical protein
MLKAELNPSSFRLEKLQKFHKHVLQIYAHKGESHDSIDTISQFSNHVCSQQNVITRLNSYDELPCYQHRCIKLIDDNNIKLALHLMPKGVKMPMHSHPEKFSIIYVVSGKLAIDNRSRFDLFSLKSSSLTKIVNTGNSSVGLPILNNLHHIHAVSDTTVFLSLRMTATKKSSSTYSKKAINSIVSTLLVSTLTSGVEVFANGNDSLRDQIQTTVQHTKQMTHKSVALLRESDNYDDRCNATSWYHKSALQGNAESQYWLGIMFLDGSGITEDEDEALRWVSLAAKQGHKDAEKLLNHLLERIPEIEC